MYSKLQIYKAIYLL